jgi:glycosyltransferase
MLKNIKTQIKISVITVVYNRENTISRAIKSIQDQEYQNIEYIIVDGKSNDNTLNVIKKLIRENDILISEKDYGIYDALNKGIKRATGDVICFLHSDDLYENNYILSNINYLFIKNNVDIIYGDATFFKKKTTNIIRIYKSPHFNVNNLSKGLMPAHPAMFIKKTVYEKHGLFNINFKIAGDFDWLCRVSKDTNISSLKIDKIFVKMQYGGISTNGLKSLYLLNKEVITALKINAIKSSFFNLLFKYIKKITEFKFIN